MRYFKQHKEINATPFEITKEEARKTLEGYWIEDAINDMFENDRQFRLFTPFSTVWTMDENGNIPIAGFYGICY